MRYRFRGVVSHNGRVVEGHVQAPDRRVANQILGNNGIFCDELREDPEPIAPYMPPMLRPATPGGGPAGGRGVSGGGGGASGGGGRDEVTSAIDSALDTAASQVDFDALANRYKGKRVWVLDRGKIRDRVKQVVAQAVQDSLSKSASRDDTLEKINTAIDKMFADKRNVSTQASPANMAMEDQIVRLSAVARRLENAISQLGNVGFVGGGGGGMAYDVPQRDKRHDKVLLEIFETNVELQRTIKESKTKADKP